MIIGFVLGNFYQLHTANACLYVLSHVLDMVDGMAARYLDQCSTFGVILDYSIDIITEMIWFIQLTPLIHNFSYNNNIANGNSIMLLMVFIIMINIFGLVFAIYNSAQGKYWKSSPYRPRLQEPFINHKGYTKLGHGIVLFYQVFWAVYYISFFYSIPNLVLEILAFSALLEIISLTMILYEQLCMYQE